MQNIIKIMDREDKEENKRKVGVTRMGIFVLQFIRQYIEKHELPPTHREMFDFLFVHLKSFLLFHSGFDKLQTLFQHLLFIHFHFIFFPTNHQQYFVGSWYNEDLLSSYFVH